MRSLVRNSGRLRARLFVTLWVGVMVLAGPAAAVEAAAPVPPAFIVAPIQDEQIDMPTAQSIAELGQSISSDPTLAADQLVALITGPDATQAATAVAELLRRAAFPIVTTDGGIIGAPSNITLGGDTIYADFTVEMARSARGGATYDAGQLASLLVPDIFKFDSGGSLDPALLVAAMGKWGKDAGSPPESQIAGAAFRALSATRGDILFGQTAQDPRFDLLQTALLIGQASGGETARFSGTSTSQSGNVSTIAGIQLAEDLDCPVFPSQTAKDLLKQVIKQDIRDVLPKILQGGFGYGFDGIDKGESIINMVLLLAGATLTLDPDKTETHFKTSPSDLQQAVTLTAHASYEPQIAVSNGAVKCWALAGLNAPGPQDLPGYRIRWRLAQDLGFYSRCYGAYQCPWFLQGKYLAPTERDSNKLDDCPGSCGELTNGDGESTLKLVPPRELKPNEGSRLYGAVRVYAVMDPKDIPEFLKLSDLTGIELVVSRPYYWALKRLIDLTIGEITHIGLPTRSTVIYVEYDGKNMYRAQGTTTTAMLGLGGLYPNVDISLDMYTCTGLRHPALEWKGKGGITNEDIGALARASAAFAAMFARLQNEPAAARAQANSWVNAVTQAERDTANQKPFEDPLTAQPDPLKSAPYGPAAAGSYHDDFTITSDAALNATMTVSNVPPTHQFEDGWAEKHVNGVVGDVLLKIGSESLDQPQYGWAGRISLVGSDDAGGMCPGADKDDYTYDPD